MTQTKTTPPQLAKRWGVSADKILSLIRSGELRAIDVSLGKKRARYLIDERDIEEFEQRRESRPVRQEPPFVPGYKEYV
jgi:excisionase family DNA binding protein